MSQDYCLTCDGYSYTWVDPSPFTLNVNGQTQLTFYGLWDDEAQDYVPADNWSTTNASVLAVSPNGQWGV